VSKVYVGMSGGVDSALAAALLVEQGHDVLGVYMRNWSQDLPGFKCPWADDLADAERVAVTLGIDLEVWDCEAEYRATVVDYLVDAYSRGYTPNPDVMCNQTVKFGTFAERAFADGADFVATGHYARVEHGVGGAPARLLRSCDEHKDQTYFMWRVAGSVYNRALFPIGGYANKAEVRAACAERGLGIENKPDSDGICFIGPVGLRTFLLQTLDRRPGDIVEWETGAVLGRHEGAFLYTVGQRRGLNIGGGPARYVVRTDTQANVVYVSADQECPALKTRELTLEDERWIAGERPAEGTYLVRTRHTGPLREAQLRYADGAAKLVFPQDVPAVAPGQSAVLYDDVVCVGGGLVSK
jgi:tRNA-specific 2-thiouridylase